MTKLLFLLVLITPSIFGQTEKKYTVSELNNDLVFLKQKLEKNHPNLYLYTSKQTLDVAFDSLSNSLKEPMTELEFYKHMSIISSIIKDGHSIILPSNSTTSYHNANSKFLPYKLKIINQSLFVEMVLTNNNAITEGAEILGINGVDSKTILHQLIERQVRDGYNETYPTWIIDNYFREYYSYIFGHPTQFIIDYKVNNILQTATILAVSKDTINYLKQTKYPNKISLKKANDGIVYVENSDANVATLTIKDFHKAVLRKEYQQDFKLEVQSAFERLSNSKISNLVLDLRNNQGGDIEYGVYLLSYLLKDTFKVVDQYYKVTSTTYQLSKCSGEALGKHLPSNNTFKGKLYVLINGGSFSNSGIVASALKFYNRAIFIGSETGGNSKVLAGYIDEYTLPNTKIHIEIPTKQFMLKEKLPLTGRGTMPDYVVNETIDDVLSNTDVQKEFVIKLITERK